MSLPLPSISVCRKPKIVSIKKCKATKGEYVEIPVIESVWWADYYDYKIQKKGWIVSGKEKGQIVLLDEPLQHYIEDAVSCCESVKAPSSSRFTWLYHYGDCIGYIKMLKVLYNGTTEAKYIWLKYSNGEPIPFERSVIFTQAIKEWIDWGEEKVYVLIGGMFEEYKVVYKKTFVF